MTEQQKFEAWLGIKPCGAAHEFGLAAWQARAAQDNSAELLEALERIVSFWDETVPGDCVNSMHIHARAAISKARGE